MAIDGAIPNWAAALIVGGALLAVAAVLALVGRDRLREAAPPLPEETIETTKEDIQWAKTQLQSGRR
jgi:Putative Actinobacterial Holin-X, holin superfamily III